jgi:hypothetical protein
MLPLFHHRRSTAWSDRRVLGPERMAFARRGTQLPHRLNRSDDVPGPDGPALGDGSASGGGGGVARVSKVGENGGEGSV